MTPDEAKRLCAKFGVTVKPAATEQALNRMARNKGTKKANRYLKQQEKKI